MKIVWYAFFLQQKHKFESCKFDSVLKYKFLRKKNFCMHCVYNVVQDKFSIQKTQNSKKNCFFVNMIFISTFIFLFHVLR